MRALIFITLLICLLAIPIRGRAQALPAVAFGEKERLVYVVSYKVGFVNTNVAEVFFQMSASTQNNVPVYTVHANGKVYPFYRWFFDLNDTYFSTLDARTLRPLELRTEISEGKYRYSSKFTYNWDSALVHTTYRNHARPDAKQKTMPLYQKAFDGLAHFYNLRNQNIEEFTPGKSEAMYLVLEDTIRRIQYRFVGHETKNIKGLGKFKTLRFICQLATSIGESFEDGNEFSIWISDDRNKIPLYIESPIRVGSVRAHLMRFNDLKYDLTSQIKK